MCAGGDCAVGLDLRSCRNGVVSALSMKSMCCVGVLRDMNDELLVCVALDFWYFVQTLGPGTQTH